MEACCMGEASELNDGRLDRRNGGVCGEVPVKETLGAETLLRDRRGWCAWYGMEPSRRCGVCRFGVGPLDGGNTNGDEVAEVKV